MRILYQNLADDCAVTASGERSGFPATNVQHPFLIRRWRSLVVSSEQSLLFDAGSGLTVKADTLAIVQHNLSSTAVVKFQANSIDSWSTPPVDQTAVWSEGIILVNLSAAQDYQLWRVSITDSANPDGYVEIGRIVIALRYQVEELPDSAVELDTIDTTVISKSITRQTYADLGVQARAYTLSMGIMGDTTRQSLAAVYAAVGQHTPVVLVADEKNPTKLPPIYCTMAKTVRYTHAGGWGWRDDGLKFVEEF